MKYLIIEKNGLELPIIFPEVLGHDEIVQTHVTIVRAGFVTLDGNDVYTSGKSVSLGLSSLPTDANLIKKAIAFQT